MSWMQKLHETYERCKGREPPGSKPLLPIGHSSQQAHIEITLEADGTFRGARIVEKEETVIPATESSASRVGTRPPPHPLCDKVQYCAADYTNFGGAKPSFFKEYKEQLDAWCQSNEFTHPKAQAVLAYVRKGTLVADLVREKVLHLGPEGKLLTQWREQGQVPAIFRLLTAKNGERDQGDAFIRWRVREPDNPCTAVWEDGSLQDAWAGYLAGTMTLKGVCLVSGESDVLLAQSHPKRIRHPGDGAKLVSANDASGFTFRGRFTDDTGQQACGVGYEVTQKAHNALRWLVDRQGYRNGDQVIVTWSVGGKAIPDPFGDGRSLFLDDAKPGDAEPASEQAIVGDVGQAFARRLNMAIAGYRAKLDATDDIVVMALDAATPGRMAITFYRELNGSEFLDRIEAWHLAHAWPQNFGKEAHFTGAPAPRDIAEAAFGRRLDDKLRKATVERLLPCIVDGRPLPRDLVESAVHRTAHRSGMETWEFEKCLGIACGLFRGFWKERDYRMTLETDRTTRDYLYGRLLAIAEHIEGRALYVAGESRDTTAARLMQRFADRPASTWPIIERQLGPYKSRLRARRPAFLHEMEKLLDDVVGSFAGDDFLKDGKLSGEFLLGYHCQRQALAQPKVTAAETNDEPATE
jgi:CRISPR-associated protein Csd1